jgi:hypothetical protein
LDEDFGGFEVWVRLEGFDGFGASVGGASGEIDEEWGVGVGVECRRWIGEGEAADWIGMRWSAIAT